VLVHPATGELIINTVTAHAQVLDMSRQCLHLNLIPSLCWFILQPDSFAGMTSLRTLIIKVECSYQMYLIFKIRSEIPLTNSAFYMKKDQFVLPVFKLHFVNY
jgi:hypothetical protein